MIDAYRASWLSREEIRSGFDAPAKKLWKTQIVTNGWAHREAVPIEKKNVFSVFVVIGLASITEAVILLIVAHKLTFRIEYRQFVATETIGMLKDKST